MQERYYNLDLLKAVAAVLIVFHHYQQVFNVTFDGINFFGGSFYWGYLVELFFLISGFVMAVSNRKEKNIFQKFFGKCIRIYPSTVLACSATILIVFVGYFLLGEFIDTSVDYTNIMTVISSYLLIFSGWFLNIELGINNPTWYLCVLLLCYFIYYAIEVVSEKAHVTPNILYFIVFLISFGGMYFGKSLPWFFTYQNQRGYTCFFSGVLLYNLVVKRLSNRQVWLTVLGLEILTALGVWRWGIGSWGVLVLFFYPMLVLVAVTIKQLPGYATRYLGVSYQTYLWHTPCFMFLKLIGRVSGIQVTLTYFTMILVTVFVEIVAMVVYRYYEIPITRWLKKYIRSMRHERR